MNKSIEERIWPYVRWEPAPAPNDLVRPVPGDCAIWTRSLSPQGYPSQISINGQLVRVGRWTYEHYVAPLSTDRVPDHLCRVRACINPLHVEAITDRENVARGIGISARNRQKTHCPKGHPLVAVNRPERKRHCPICVNLYHKQLRLKRSLATKEASAQ